jgi:hypothetical protein
LVKAYAPPIAPLSVKLPVPPKELALAKVTAPEAVAAVAELLIKAPPLLMPVPFKVNAELTV